MTDVHGPDPDVVAVVSEFFARESAAASQDRDDPAAALARLWEQATSLELPLVGIEEALGGTGGSFHDTIAIVRAAARHGASIPLAEHHLAAWLLTRTRERPADGPMTIAPGTERDTARATGDTATGRLHDVPWARWVTKIVAVLPADGPNPSVLSVDPARSSLIMRTDLAGIPRDDVDLVTVGRLDRAHVPDLRAEFRVRGALLRTAQIAGTLDAVSAMCLDYATNRVQFGRPIAAFDGVRQHLVTLSQATVMTAVSLDRAVTAYIRHGSSFEALAAKLVAGENAAVAVRAAHQLHGAIGMTREYPLHRFTTRLRTWQAEFGASRELAVALGTCASEHPFADLILGIEPRTEVNW